MKLHHNLIVTLFIFTVLVHCHPPSNDSDGDEKITDDEEEDVISKVVPTPPNVIAYDQNGIVGRESDFGGQISFKSDEIQNSFVDGRKYDQLRDGGHVKYFTHLSPSIEGCPEENIYTFGDSLVCAENEIDDNDFSNNSTILTSPIAKRTPRQQSSTSWDYVNGGRIKRNSQGFQGGRSRSFQSLPSYGWTTVPATVAVNDGRRQEIEQLRKRLHKGLDMIENAGPIVGMLHRAVKVRFLKLQMERNKKEIDLFESMTIAEQENLIARALLTRPRSKSLFEGDLDIFQNELNFKFNPKRVLRRVKYLTAALRRGKFEKSYHREPVHSSTQQPYYLRNTREQPNQQSKYDVGERSGAVHHISPSRQRREIDDYSNFAFNKHEEDLYDIWHELILNERGEVEDQLLGKGKTELLEEGRIRKKRSTLNDEKSEIEKKREREKLVSRIMKVVEKQIGDEIINDILAGITEE